MSLVDSSSGNTDRSSSETWTSPFEGRRTVRSPQTRGHKYIRNGGSTCYTVYGVCIRKLTTLQITTSLINCCAIRSIINLLGYYILRIAQQLAVKRFFETQKSIFKTQKSFF